MTISKKEFAALGLQDRYDLVKANGQFVASRNYAGFQVHLYAINQYYYEVWTRIGLNQVNWIELVSNDLAQDNYGIDIDIASALGI